MADEFEHGAERSFGVLGADKFFGMMTQARFALHEQHADGASLRYHDPVVPSAARQLGDFAFEGSCGCAEVVGKCRVAMYRGLGLLDHPLAVDAPAIAQTFERGFERGNSIDARGVVSVAEIERERHECGNHIAGTRFDREFSHGGDQSLGGLGQRFNFLYKHR